MGILAATLGTGSWTPPPLGAHSGHPCRVFRCSGTPGLGFRWGAPSIGPFRGTRRAASGILRTKLASESRGTPEGTACPCNCLSDQRPGSPLERGHLTGVCLLSKPRNLQKSPPFGRQVRIQREQPVSYTHLTLPTICSV
eukprot:15440649-Alexandrium_andersonii.AAC.1